MKNNTRAMSCARLGTGLMLVWVLAGCTTTPAVVSVAPPPSMTPPTTLEAVGILSKSISLPKGYLDPKAVPNSLALLPPPPADGSAALAADQEAFRTGAAAPPERVAIAAADADLRWPQVVAGFEPVVGISLSDGSRPHTEMLLRRAMADAGLSTYAAKDHYKRVRPFVVNTMSTCAPDQEAQLRTDGSYPSGHTAIGWMLALVLTDLMPTKTDAVFRRGYDFGESRIVCRAHWKSDTTYGRDIAAATYARLQSDPQFNAQRALARAELAKAAAN